ncbi:MFS transporter [Teichococcus vastitatis]|uniref:MFS transporter n=1 Tax=Teichococcus vastitatis TaxID=2307076 RepID=A0ABS9W1N6_9PROT|nr:MFS transporter [Pseudoroseomonas vastitatis]MCI0753101.1 MFS transporter [Pseudoroseomonas vastitatis]
MTTNRDPHAARRAIRLVFLANAITFAAWAPLVPLVRAELLLSEATLGLVLLALGAGGILAMPLTGGLVIRFGSRATCTAAGIGFALVLPFLALAPNVWLLGATVFLFGATGGMMDVSMNAQAVAVEARGSRPVMSSIHGVWSLGGLLGVAAVAAMLRAGLPPLGAVLLVSAAALLLLLTQFRALLDSSSDRPGEAGHGFALPRGPVLGIGVLALLAFLAEGSVLDWGGILLSESRGVDLTLAGAGYAAFSLAMAAARLTGDSMTKRFGAVAMLRAGAVLAAAGFVAAALLPWGWTAMAGFLLVGFGLANIVPLLISAAGRLPGVAPGTALAAVATLGYSGLLAGPAAIGFVAEAVGLELALAGVGALMLLVVARAGLARG